MSDKYKNSKIYCIKNNLNNDVYVGSTIKPLSRRMVEHKSSMKKHPDRILYNKMNELGSEQFYIELIEEYPCENLVELHRREGYYIRKLSTLNKLVAGRNKNEYYKDNKDAVLAKRKQHYEDNKQVVLARNRAYNEANKDTIKAKQKEWIEINKDVIAQKCKAYREKNKEAICAQHKQYREANREQISEHKKQWYEAKREQLLEKHDCPCGGKYVRCSKARHERSKKHQEYLSSRSTTANNSDSGSDSD